MTVRELIEELKKQDPDMHVGGWSWSHEAEPQMYTKVEVVAKDFGFTFKPDVEKVVWIE
jgi:hypothetical protein